MSRGVNKAIIVGSLGNDPDVKYSGSGSCVCTVSVATSEKWKDKNSGQDVEKTEWHKITMFGKLGEIAAQYLKKGSQAYFEGKIVTQKWQDQSGQDKYSTSIYANEMQMLGSRPEPQGQSASQAGHDNNQVKQPPAQHLDASQQFEAPDNHEFDSIPF